MEKEETKSVSIAVEVPNILEILRHSIKTEDIEEFEGLIKDKDKLSVLKEFEILKEIVHVGTPRFLDKITKIKLDQKDIVFGDTLLHYTVAKKEYEMSAVLLQKYEDINIPNDSGKTPLAISCISGDLKMIKMLYKYGAKMTAIGDEISPLCLSIYNGHFFCTLFLLALEEVIKSLTVHENFGIKFIDKLE